MASQSAFTTVTLRRLPQGESLQITISANKALNILKDKDTGAEIPEISSSNPIIVTPKVYGTSGTVAKLSDVSWKMDGASIPSTVSASINSDGSLTIKSSPIGKLTDTSLHPIMLSFAAKATLNGHTYDVEKTLVINCAETSANSYWGAIEANNGTTLDADTTQTTLSPMLYLGTTKQSGFSVKWYKTGAGSGGADLELTSANASAQHVTLSGNNLAVTRDAVDSAAHFEAHFYVGGNEVEAEGCSIVDIADELQLDAQGDTFAEEGGTIKITVKAYSSKTGNKINITNVSQVSIVATDSIRQGTFPASICTKAISDSCCVITTKEEDWLVPNNGSDASSKPYIKCGDSQAADTAVATKAEATKCEVILLIGATIDM